MGFLIDDSYVAKITKMTLSHTSFIMGGQVLSSVWTDKERTALTEALISMQDRIKDLRRSGMQNAPFDMKIDPKLFPPC